MCLPISTKYDWTCLVYLSDTFCSGDFDFWVAIKPHVLLESLETVVVTGPLGNHRAWRESSSYRVTCSFDSTRRCCVRVLLVSGGWLVGVRAYGELTSATAVMLLMMMLPMVTKRWGDAWFALFRLQELMFGRVAHRGHVNFACGLRGCLGHARLDNVIGIDQGIVKALNV